MKATEFADLNPLAEALYEQCDRWLASEGLVDIREALRQAAAKLPANYSLSIDVELRVFDLDREQSINLLSTGLCSTGQAPAFRTGADSTAHRYIANGELCELPHDRCPICWDYWDFKIELPECPHCGAALGQNVKILLDRDTCPHCENGRIARNQPTCTQCSFTIDPNIVHWG